MACTPSPAEQTSAKLTRSTATALSLGTTQRFAILAGSTVTNTGPTRVTGDLGVSPGNAVTGFPPGLVNGGTIQAGNAAATQAQSDATPPAQAAAVLRARAPVAPRGRARAAFQASQGPAPAVRQAQAEVPIRVSMESQAREQAGSQALTPLAAATLLAAAARE